MKTQDLTICLHASDAEVANNQTKIFEYDSKNFRNVNTRKRHEAHPEAYSSYSEMLNSAINDSKTNVVVLVNDKVLPSSGELTRMISLLDLGFGYVGLYSIGFCAVTKDLIQKIGWLDERFLGGGYEDDDFLLRLRLNNIAIYDSHESNYNYMSKPSKQSVSVPLSKSEPHFLEKWKLNQNRIEKALKEEDYSRKYRLDGLENREFLSWDCSILGYCYGVGPRAGIPVDKPIENFHGFSRVHRFNVVPYGSKFVGNNRQIIDLTKGTNE